MTAIPRELSQYHSGLVVEDLAEAIGRYGDLLGLRFAQPRHSVLDVVVDGEPRRAELLVSYSLQGPPYLELIEDLSGGVWGPLGMSHIGFWTPDLDASAERFADAGWPARVVGDRFTYHEGDGGIWTELVSTAFEPQLLAWLARG